MAATLVDVRRSIIGFHRDDDGDWVAELDCLHNQHVRHDPPLWPRPWVLTEGGRKERLGSPLDCPLCDRAEMPDGLRLARTAGPFDADTLPPGLRAPHVVGDRTWGRLHVHAGTVRFVLATDPAIDIELRTGNEQAIPPGTIHTVALSESARISIDFFVAP